MWQFWLEVVQHTRIPKSRYLFQKFLFLQRCRTMGASGAKVLPIGSVANGPMDKMTVEVNLMTAVAVTIMAVVAGILVEVLMTALPGPLVLRYLFVILWVKTWTVKVMEIVGIRAAQVGIPIVAVRAKATQVGRTAVTVPTMVKVVVGGKAAQVGVPIVTVRAKATQVGMAAVAVPTMVNTKTTQVGRMTAVAVPT